MRANSQFLKKIREHLETKGLKPFGTADDYLTYVVYQGIMTLDEPTLTKELLTSSMLYMENKPTYNGFYRGVNRALAKLQQFKNEPYVDISKFIYIIAREIN